MGIGVDVGEVTGLSAFTSSLADAAEHLGDLSDVNTTAAAVVIAAVEAPRRTGALAASVAAVIEADGFTLTAGAPYAAYVHAANPFLTRALTAHEDAVVEAYAQHIDTAVSTIEGA